MELAAGLKTAVAEFGAREAEVERERRTRNFAEKRRFDAASAAEEARLASEVAATDEEFQAERERFEARFGERRAVVKRAHASSTRQLAEEVEGLRQRTVTDMQMRALQAKGGGKAAIAKAEADLEASLAETANLEQEWSKVRQSVRGDMRGYFGFLRGLSPKRAAAMELADLDGSREAEALRSAARE